MTDFPTGIGHLPNEKEVEFRPDGAGGPRTKPPGAPPLELTGGPSSDEGGGWWWDESGLPDTAIIRWDQELTNPVVVVGATG